MDVSFWIPNNGLGLLFEYLFPFYFDIITRFWIFNLLVYISAIFIKEIGARFNHNVFASGFVLKVFSPCFEPPFSV